MRLTSAQAKGRIKNVALKNGADPRVLMRIYMMERFLERVSLSAYKDNFIWWYVFADTYLRESEKSGSLFAFPE